MDPAFICAKELTGYEACNAIYGQMIIPLLLAFIVVPLFVALVVGALTRSITKPNFWMIIIAQLIFQAGAFIFLPYIIYML